jgi:hypothetical protein
MNNARRAGSAKARGLIGQAKEIIAQAASEEREYFDDMPANLQGGDTGQRADADAAALDKADDSLEEVLTALDVIGVDPTDELERLISREPEPPDAPPG